MVWLKGTFKGVIRTFPPLFLHFFYTFPSHHILFTLIPQISLFFPGTPLTHDAAAMSDVMDMFSKREDTCSRLAQQNRMLQDDKVSLERKLRTLEDAMVNAALALRERGKVVTLVRGVLRRNDAVRSDLCGVGREVRSRKLSRVELQSSISRVSDGAQGTDRLIRQLLDAFTETELLHAGVGMGSPCKRTLSLKTDASVRTTSPRSSPRTTSPPRSVAGSRRSRSPLSIEA